MSDFESFFSRHLYGRIRDCWNRPVTGVPGREITLLERVSDDYNVTFRLTGRKVKTVNFASYNYLGFAQAEGPCADAVDETVQKYAVANSSPRALAGTHDIHQRVEELVARFVGKPAAIVASMGFATNSTNIPALVGQGCLIISDELNHSSIVTGARNSKATVRVFKHNDVADLEDCLRDAISQGTPRLRRPWKKILVIVEGLYSMEGSVCNLPGIVALKDKYKFYLYMDEAHSIGALGKSGRGVCDYWGISPDKVDILMGTFTKSFGAAGGYIAGSKELIAHLRSRSYSSVYGESMTPLVCQQVISSLTIILGEDGTDDGQRRIKRLSDNSNYLRHRLKKLGFVVQCDHDSPIIPLLVYHPGKCTSISRQLLERGFSVVVVGYPATSLATSRIRFCVSAAHTKEDLDRVIAATNEVGGNLNLKLERIPYVPEEGANDD